MQVSRKTKELLAKIKDEGTKLGDLRKIAKEIKRDHARALELWSTKKLQARLLAILIMDKKRLTQDFIDELDRDIRDHGNAERLQLMDWLMANQLTKDKNTLALIHSWENSESALQRRMYWYHQARLRWVGQTPPDNTEELLEKINDKIENEDPAVQWAMNYTAAWIGVFEEAYRPQCIVLGEKTGLYKDEIVARNCTPNYLPEFIRTEVRKRAGK